MSSSIEDAHLALITEAHRAACNKGDDMYEDPVNGLYVFSEVAHLKRGQCCGNGCRHCPYPKKKRTDVTDDSRPTPLVRKPAERGAAGRRLIAAVRGCVFECLSSVVNTLRLSSVVGALRRTLDQTPPPPPLKAEGTVSKRKKSGLYTRAGDSGTTRVLNGSTVHKSSAICEAMGDVDELSVKLGFAAHSATQIAVRQRLTNTQTRLLDAGAVLCSLDEGGNSNVLKVARKCFDDADAAIQMLEAEIDELDSQMPPLRNFIVPGGGLASLTLHDARVVCRRAERHVWRVVHAESPDGATEGDGLDQARLVARFLNRLSDYLFAAARKAAHDADFGDEIVDIRKARRARHGNAQND
ncbi:cobalamin adenosyltransferase-domain-containing protein [Pelagophyceae sp. CCMP2097]|nr:cobalamin adenosyltransferase-domain-containing protein [Pelagophyceae sp. CCMP2097]